MVFRKEVLARDAEKPKEQDLVPTVNLGPHSHDAPPEAERHNVVVNNDNGVNEADNVEAAKESVVVTREDATQSLEHDRGQPRNQDRTTETPESPVVEQATAAPGEKRSTARKG